MLEVNKIYDVTDFYYIKGTDNCNVFAIVHKVDRYWASMTLFFESYGKIEKYYQSSCPLEELPNKGQEVDLKLFKLLYL